MAFDPLQEDCLRLILASMKRERISLDDAHYIQKASDAFSADPASLIHTDRDRSFHLVAKATEIVDYRLPFLSDEEEIERLGKQAENYLREAAELDSGNWDAQRMLAALDAVSNDAYVSYLLDHKDKVERAAAALQTDAEDPYDREFARDLGQRPWLRWLAALASRALIAGQYRLSLKIAEDSLTLAPEDPTGARHTAMLALAKLEAEPMELEAFRARHALAYRVAEFPRRRTAMPALDAWTLIAQMNLAYRALDFDGADRALHSIIRAYPHAAEVLFYQSEFPDGVFGRVNVEPGSADELVLALSEATPLLQEGMGTPDDASFSVWLAEHELVQSGLDGQISRERTRGTLPHLGGDN